MLRRVSSSEHFHKMLIVTLCKSFSNVIENEAILSFPRLALQQVAKIEICH